jgi:protein involved in polysaccharide export with SLBB domain
MLIRGQRRLLAALWEVLGACLGSAGCQSTHGPLAPAVTGLNSGEGEAQIERISYRASGEQNPVSGLPNTRAQLSAAGLLPAPAVGPEGTHGPGPLPVELTPTSHPPYTVAPPDILYLDTLRLVPRGPYRLEALDQLQIIVTPTLPNQPIAGIYIVSPDGVVNLGFSYGAVRIAGLTVEQSQEMIRRHLGGTLRDPQVSVAALQYRSVQQARGEHLVRPDGTIGLGTYGSVYVAGLTLGQAKCVVEQHLSNYFVNPQVSVDVAAYNSRFYYVITDGGGYGQQIFKFPVTGNEYVLDAITNVGGLSPVSSKRKIWVARPAPCHYPCFQVLPVDWRALTEGGQTCTNYQLFPGDRVYVRADGLIALDNWLAKILAPIERLFGITLLGSTTVRTVTGDFNNGTGGFGIIAVP